MISVPIENLVRELERARESGLYSLSRKTYSIPIRLMIGMEETPTFLIGTHSVFLSRFSEVGDDVLTYCRKCQNSIQLKTYFDFYLGEGEPECEYYQVAEILEL
jgi:hypothetical protein